MIRRTAALLAAGLVLAACSGAGSEPVASDVVPTDESSTTRVGSVAPNTDVPATDGTDDSTAAERIEAIRQDPESDRLDVALAEYAALFGPLPGTPTIPFDDTIPTSATHVLDTIEGLRADLTPEQAAAFDAELERLDSIEPVSAFLLDESGTEGPDGEGFARPQGLRSNQPATPASDEIQNEIRLVGEQIRAALGGEQILAWVEIVPNGSLGNATAQNLALGELDPKRAELGARDIIANCVIKLTESVVDGDSLDTSRDSKPAVIHEVFHCWQFGRLGLDIVKMNAMDDWAKEGMAAYFGDVLGGLNRFNANWWSGYLVTQVEADGTWPLYSSNYGAIGFWSRVAEGSDIVAAMKRSLDSAPDDDAMYEAAIAALVDLPWLAAGTVQRSEWGSGWTAAGPGIPRGPRVADRVSVKFTDGPVTESVRPAAQRTVRFDVEAVPASPGSIMRLALDGTAVARVGDNDVVVNGVFSLTEWCLGDCTCPDGRAAFPPVRVLGESTSVTASLVGVPAGGSSALVEVVVFNPDEYECENPDLGEVDDSLLGTWRANPLSVATMFAESSGFGAPDQPLDVAAATGDVLMTFAEGGVGQLAYRNVGVFLNDEALGEITFNGSGSFSWGVIDGQILIDGTTFEITVSSRALGAPLTITSDDVPEAGFTELTASIAGDSMTISESEGSAGKVFFPNSWTRTDG